MSSAGQQDGTGRARLSLPGLSCPARSFRGPAGGRRVRVHACAHVCTPVCTGDWGSHCRDQAPDRYAGPHEVAPAPGEAVPSQVTPEAAGRRALRSGWHRWSPCPSPGEGGGGRAGEGASRPPQSCGDPSGWKSVRELDGVCVASGPWGASSPRLWHASGGPGAGLVMCRSPAERSQPGAPTTPRAPTGMAGRPVVGTWGSAPRGDASAVFCPPGAATSRSPLPGAGRGPHPLVRQHHHDH